MNNGLVAMRQLEERFVSWASSRDDIRAAVVVGSFARTDHPADEWSDLDIGFSTTNVERYLSSEAWLGEIADVWTWYPDPTGVTRHVLFEGGLDAGLAPLPHSSFRIAVRFVPILRRFPFILRVIPGGRTIRAQLDEGAAYTRRGVRVILDKDGVVERFLTLFPPGAAPARPQPSQEGFLESVSQFWFEAVWTAKHLRRGELWYAKCAALDGRLKSLLVQMIEWRTHAERGPRVDTWESGRYLEEWCDAPTLDALRATFAYYDEEDLWRALVATMDVYRRLAVETAWKLSYAYPSEVDAKITAWVTSRMEERTKT